MRQIFLDTETTGLYPAQGHRVIEIAAVEMINRQATHAHFHQYLKPDCEIDPAAQEVHGITIEFLQDKPEFAAIAEDFLQFIDGAELVIHNAPFDVGFLNSELGKIGKQPLSHYCGNIIDTLKIAKNSRPGQRNNLDALCRHFGIDNSKRTLHGALLDAELLAEVYMAMTRGQESLMMDLSQTPKRSVVDNRDSRLPLIIKQANAEELAAHESYLATLEKAGNLVWKH